MILASSVAYVAQKENNVEPAFVSAFEDMDMDVHIITDKNILKTDFETYDIIFIGRGRIRNIKKILEIDKPVVVANPKYAKIFGFTERRISKIVSNAPLEAKRFSEILPVYTQARFDSRNVGIPYYYISDEYIPDGVIRGVDMVSGDKKKSGAVTLYLPNNGGCFYGIVESEYWTEFAKEIFIECASVSSPSGAIHDIGIDAEYSNGINGIRIKDVESGNYLLRNLSILECNKKYTISYQTENFGNVDEDIEFRGELGNFSWSATKIGLHPGSTTTTGSKTINITQNTGIYTIEIVAEIDNDINLEDNVRTRDVFIEGVCILE